MLDVGWLLPKAFSGEFRSVHGRAVAHDPLTRPAPAGENAGGGPPSPQRGRAESWQGQKNLNPNAELHIPALRQAQGKLFAGMTATMQYTNMKPKKQDR